MKFNMFKYNYYFLFLILAFLSLIFLTKVTYAADVDGRNPTCVLAQSISACETTPSSQKITIKNLYFCTSQPTLPTSTSTIFNRTANGCINIFKGSTEIIVAKGTDVNLVGTYTPPPNGNYTFAVAEFSPIFKVTGSISLKKSGVTYLSSNGTGGAGSGVLTVCSTVNTSINFYRAIDNSSNTMLGGALCGISPAAGELSIFLNSFDDVIDSPSQTFPGTNGTVPAVLLGSNDALAYSKTPGSGIANNTNGVTSVLGVMPININFTNDKKIIMLFNNSGGMNVYFANKDWNISQPPTVGFGPAYFDMTITTE